MYDVLVYLFENCQQAEIAFDRDRVALGIRSSAGDPSTTVVDKGQTTQTILAAPQADGQEASVQTP